ncbi:endoglucanase IV precursor [Aureobasidium pullulans]|nr:endoglucanase IV precursor [Aureobasidium pullulans]
MHLDGLYILSIFVQYIKMKYLAAVLGCATLAAAHGYIDNATIGGDEYQFYQPYLDPYMNPAEKRVSRPVQGNGPVTDVDLLDIQCGGYSEGGIVGSSPAPLEAAAEAGSNVTLHWTLWPDSHFGPTITYMAACPDEGCENFMPNKTAVWFKIAEQGRSADKKTWGTDPLTKPGNAGYTYAIPECIKAGHYLVRHELVALHDAAQYPGPQFYPGCHQIKVSGEGTTVPKSLVAFPGAYKGQDVIYDASKAEYTVPGPAVFQCAA